MIQNPSINHNRTISHKDKIINLSKNQSQQNKKFTPINSYKPQGNLIYDEELMNKLEDKFL